MASVHAAVLFLVGVLIINIPRRFYQQDLSVLTRLALAKQIA